MSFANKIIINADDFGYSVAVNQAIIRSFERYLVTSTSLMANMPGFEDAIGLIGRHSFLHGHVGLHFNLTEGVPLSPAIRECRRFCDQSGNFAFSRNRSLFFLSDPEQKAVCQELRAQLDKLLAAGIRPNHLDSHHHVHTEWAIARLVTRLGREYGIRKVRLTRNMGLQNDLIKKVYKKIFNHWYFRGFSGITGTDYFGDIRDLQFMLGKRPRAGKSIEIMVHPLLNETGELVDLDRKNLQDLLRTLIDHRHTISYTDL